MEHKIPKHWKQYKLEDLIIYMIGGIWGEEPTSSPSESYILAKVLRATDIKHWKSEKGINATLRSINKVAFSLRQLQENDIIMEISGGSETQAVGRTVLIDKETIEKNNYPLVCANFFRLIRLSSWIYTPFIHAYLQFQYSKGVFDKYQTHTTGLRNLQLANFLTDFQVVLPSISEQKRIIVQLNNELENIEKKLNDNQIKLADLKNFRQSVLEDAVSGKLTEEWRMKAQDIVYNRLAFF